MRRVRIISVDGKISAGIYEVDQSKTSRKGYVSVVNSNGSLTVNRNRIVECDDSSSLVVKIGDRYRASCTECEYTEDILSVNSVVICPTHGQLNLNFKNGEPVEMSEETAVAVETEAVTEVATEQQTVKVRQERKVKEAVPVDFAAMIATENCVVYTKSNVTFDHAKINVKAHVLIYTGENPRKMCFNTYNDALGKKGKAIDLQSFVEGKEGENKWYSVKDLQKTIDKLIKDGYEQQK